MQRGFKTATVGRINLIRSVADILFGQFTLSAFKTGKVRDYFIGGRAISILTAEFRRECSPHNAI
ncbi:hypothetical protein WM09_18425 [Burkholderia ubonensis]|uniref:Uncharacterized protein n=1 Tax=Burkholderia ubonensis TaxID=101571 RepID=A0AAW3NEW4_9BURK|nr:hypothetical protein WI78_22740 [Burkholderia ubonensis]KVG77005.1 hypothetical protein WJ34_04150 [Burkholderia ubonensis]KVH22293.1 hypothetical protein WJ37_13160 [Burkholderia ubonensis]KVH50650.1 hypothetical protein WJ38_10260 [Burkholderia ubonensis]KVH85626.1 hypothetical protein WJ43_10315 [Burkholderia ubonensis]